MTKGTRVRHRHRPCRTGGEVVTTDGHLMRVLWDDGRYEWVSIANLGPDTGPAPEDEP